MACANATLAAMRVSALSWASGVSGMVSSRLVTLLHFLVNGASTTGEPSAGVLKKTCASAGCDQRGTEKSASKP